MNDVCRKELTQLVFFGEKKKLVHGKRRDLVFRITETSHLGCQRTKQPLSREIERATCTHYSSEFRCQKTWSALGSVPEHADTSSLGTIN